MTHGEFIRQATDEQLAAIFSSIIAENNQQWFQRLHDAGICLTLVEVPILNINHHLNFLKTDMEEKL